MPGPPAYPTRVVLRRHVGVRDGRPVFTDIIGELVDASAGRVVIRGDDGTTVAVPEDQVHRLREVPPGRAAILALEAVAARGWPAPETTGLGDWLLRAGEGWTRRANSALLLGDPGMPMPEAFERVTAWYRERGLVPRLAVPLPAMAPADHVATGLGWAVDVEADVLTGPVADGPPDPRVGLSPEPDAEWADVYRAKAMPPVGTRILAAPDTVAFGSIRDGGVTVAIGRGVVLDGWLGITSMEVRPEHRRRGLGDRMLRALLAWGAGHGATRCYLQTESTNQPALAFYRSRGFTRHHRYRNRFITEPGRRDT
jgi:ribosomal protein S18 acetylase RimI-like enzyme